ncbi:MAG: pantetheine-phosphate adenylyltransferase [Candidatus Melainabacteria bacterium]|uniref:Phosphopantetheine adenylyltransferase n=1 Tax=Candidatus Obscuribacter phosphatis TaxID=1906157 RepID=A0A8J7PA27_9BACT|nr:pantetheine-phosphate adenylyltransferase [Candidatus Obscuribacter phosphatis]MCA0315761.1 pantetheine-phosphate adenylyltransferase [Candidatus Melainabacteria bacterium]OPZ86500.1 MAG: Phosphopantetheine adenylyltransferase [bacterium ADurb.Bin425]
MARAIYPGSFDPMTLGHLDIIRRASKLFDEVIMAVVGNPGKSPLLPMDIRKNLIEESVKDLRGVKVEEFQGLTVDYAKATNTTVLIRGLRAISDFEAELGMAQANKQLFPELETIFLMTKAEYSFISSSTVKEIARLGGDVSQFVPHPVNDYLREHFSRGTKQK